MSHGATGKGNDQVRFELTYYALKPDIKIISPWKNAGVPRAVQGQGRPDRLCEEERHTRFRATIKKPYSEDENLMHISHEAGILENPAHVPDDSVYSRTVSPQKAPDKITMHRGRLQGRHAREDREQERRHDEDRPAGAVPVRQQGRLGKRHRQDGHGGEQVRRHKVPRACTRRRAAPY